MRGWKPPARSSVTILAPENAEPSIAEDLKSLGIHAFSSVQAGGRGQHGVRPSTWLGPNVQIEIVVDAAIVDRILEVLEAKHRKINPCVAWITDVDAWPAEKF
ncbi:MAG: hypothetical protein IPJ34_23220 [Myxococcales bacterium]|nr:hypothetical protein [Myxococcales bacterium]